MSFPRNSGFYFRPTPRSPGIRHAILKFRKSPGTLPDPLTATRVPSDPRNKCFAQLILRHSFGSAESCGRTTPGMAIPTLLIFEELTSFGHIINRRAEVFLPFVSAELSKRIDKRHIFELRSRFMVPALAVV